MRFRWRRQRRRRSDVAFAEVDRRHVPAPSSRFRGWLRLRGTRRRFRLVHATALGSAGASECAGANRGFRACPSLAEICGGSWTSAGLTLPDGRWLAECAGLVTIAPIASSTAPATPCAGGDWHHRHCHRSAPNSRLGALLAVGGFLFRSGLSAEGRRFPRPSASMGRASRRRRCLAASSPPRPPRRRRRRRLRPPSRASGWPASAASSSPIASTSDVGRYLHGFEFAGLFFGDATSSSRSSSMTGSRRSPLRRNERGPVQANAPVRPFRSGTAAVHSYRASAVTVIVIWKRCSRSRRWPRL